MSGGISEAATQQPIMEKNRADPQAGSSLKEDKSENDETTVSGGDSRPSTMVVILPMGCEWVGLDPAVRKLLSLCATLSDGVADQQYTQAYERGKGWFAQVPRT